MKKSEYIKEKKKIVNNYFKDKISLAEYKFQMAFLKGRYKKEK